MSQRPLDENQDPSKASDAQKIALYVANLLLARNVLGNLSIAAADRPVAADDFVAFKGTTGLKVYDSGYGPASFDPAGAAAAALAAAEEFAEAHFQRSERRVQAGETRTVRAWTSDYVVGPFVVADTATVAIEDEAVLEIG